MLNKFENFFCEEYLASEFKFGYFHPTEAYDILPSEESRISKCGEFLIIGRVWDCHDFEYCYRKSKNGIWALEGSGNFLYFSDSIHDFVEGWYPGSSQTWACMESRLVWRNIERYFIHHDTEYGWNSKELLILLGVCVKYNFDALYFAKADKYTLSIALENGFSSRTKKRLVDIRYSKVDNEYRIYYQESFFDCISIANFKLGKVQDAVKSIHAWLVSNS